MATPAELDYRYAYNIPQTVHQIFTDRKVTWPTSALWKPEEVRKTISTVWDEMEKTDSSTQIDSLHLQPIVQTAALIELDETKGAEAKFVGLGEDGKRWAMYGSVSYENEKYEREVEKTILSNLNERPKTYFSGITAVFDQLKGLDSKDLNITANRAYETQLNGYPNPTPADKIAIFALFSPQDLASIRDVGNSKAFTDLNALTPNEQTYVMYESLRRAKMLLEKNDMEKAMWKHEPGSDVGKVQEKINFYTVLMNSIENMSVHKFEDSIRNLKALRHIQKNILTVKAEPPAAPANT